MERLAGRQQSSIGAISLLETRPLIAAARRGDTAHYSTNVVDQFDRSTRSNTAELYIAAAAAAAVNVSTDIMKGLATDDRNKVNNLAVPWRQLGTLKNLLIAWLCFYRGSTFGAKSLTFLGLIKSSVNLYEYFYEDSAGLFYSCR